MAVATPLRVRLLLVVVVVTAHLVGVALMAGCSRTVQGLPVTGSADSAQADGPGSARLPPGGAMQSGDCVTLARFAVVGCSQPHELEVYRFTRLPATFPAAYPTPAGLLPKFEPQCRAGLTDYVGSRDADASRLREFVYWPSSQSWHSGERWILCAVVEIGPDDRPMQRTGALGGALRQGLGQFQSCTVDPPSEGTLHVVPCLQPHRGEAVPGVLVLGAPADPPFTAEQANAVAEPRCRRSIDAFLNSPGRKHGVRYSWRYPLPQSWSYGYTTVVCYAETAEPVTGSLRDH